MAYGTGGGNGQAVDIGKKKDVAPDVADTGGSGAVIVGGGKKLDRMPNTEGSGLGFGTTGGKKLDIA